MGRISHNIKLVHYYDYNTSTAGLLTKFFIKVIKFIKGDGPFHTEVIINDKVRVSSFYEAGGVQVLDVNWDEIKKYAYVTEHYSETSTEEYEMTKQFIRDQIGKGYDWANIIFSQGFLPLKLDDSEKWICSEISLEVAKRLGVQEVKALGNLKTYDPNKIWQTFKSKYYKPIL
jgi:hypothetical protein